MTTARNLVWEHRWRVAAAIGVAALLVLLMLLAPHMALAEETEAVKKLNSGGENIKTLLATWVPAIFAGVVAYYMLSHLGKREHGKIIIGLVMAGIVMFVVQDALKGGKQLTHVASILAKFFGL